LHYRNNLIQNQQIADTSQHNKDVRVTAARNLAMQQERWIGPDALAVLMDTLSHYCEADAYLLYKDAFKDDDKFRKAWVKMKLRQAGYIDDLMDSA